MDEVEAILANEPPQCSVRMKLPNGEVERCELKAEETFDDQLIGWINEALSENEANWYIGDNTICNFHLEQSPEI